MQAHRKLNATRPAGISPSFHHSSVRHRSAVVLNAGVLQAGLKRGMSMICQMLHGNGADTDEQAATAGPDADRPTASAGTILPFAASFCSTIDPLRTCMLGK